MRDLSRFLSQPEGQYFEHKSLWHGPSGSKQTRDRREVRDEIAECVAAFANADGGTVVLGVEDDGRSTGHGYPADAIDQMLQVPSQRLKPTQPDGERVEWQGHELLLFEVPSAEQAVMVNGDGFPRRVHDAVIQESEEVINAIKQRGRLESPELDVATVLGLDALDLERLAAAQQGAGLAHLSAADYLRARRFADDRAGQLVLRKGALLLFARHAANIDHPNAGVRIFRVNGTERQTGARHNVQELPRVEGAIPAVIERAYEAIGAVLRRSARLHDLFFREMPEYPTFAWQEALVNAVAHRDYRITGQCVEVWLFDDRMEVVSPGRLPPEVDLDRLRLREPIHCSRNPRITRVLAELALMREQGEGIPRMFEEMEQSWLKLPELSADEHRFKVVLHNEPILQAPDAEWVRHVQALPVSHRQRRVLVAHPVGSFANSDYQALNQVDRDVAYRDLKELVELGLITEPAKPGRAARYQVVRGGAPVPVTPQRVLGARMAERGSIQNTDYREAFGVGRREATAALNQLVDDGVVVRVGERRGTRYQPGPRWEAWVGGGQLGG
jgi:ATP-dependent DNA helicase RecG